MLRPGADRKYAYILLCAAVAVLALGLVFKPNQPEPKPSPSDSELAQLQRLTQQRRLRDLSSYLTDAADGAASSLVLVGPARRSGVLWTSPPLIITTAAPSGPGEDPRSTAVTPDGRSLALQETPLPPGSPFSALSFAPVPRIRGARRTVSPPDLGDWVLVVARNSSGGVVFAHGLYQGIVNARCGAFAYRSVQSSAALSTALVGGGAFTLDGQLLGVVAECEQAPIVIAADTVAEILRQPPSVNTRLEDYYGIRADETTNVGATGTEVQVVLVWAGSRGEDAGLRPGDRIMAVDGQAVHTRADLEALVDGGANEHDLTVERGRQRASLTLSEEAKVEVVRTAYGIALGHRLHDRRLRIMEVAPDSSAHRAGILNADVLLKVGRIPVSDAASALRALGNSKSTRLLTLERDGREYEVLLRP